MRKLNLKLRIFIYFAIAAILPSILFWFLVYAKLDDKLAADYQRMTDQNVKNHIEEVDEFFNKQAEVVNSIAKAFPFIENTEGSIADFLQKQAIANQDFSNIYIVNNQGAAITSAGSILRNADYRTFMPYKKAIGQPKLVWLDPYNDRISGLRTIGIGIPIYDKRNQPQGVLIANLSYDFFDRQIAYESQNTNAKIYLINSKGDIKFTTSSEDSSIETIDKADFILESVSKDILSLKEGSKSIAYKGKNWLCTFAATPSTDWKIVFIYDADEVAAKASVFNQDIYQFITMFSIAVLVLVILLSIYLSNSISRPLLRLRDGVQELALGDLNHRITLKGMEEIKVVADTFNQMAYNLKKSYQDLFTRTDELYEKNEYLQEMNAELEASYEQLGATIEQLNESEEKYRKLVNNISDLVIVMNMDSEVVYVNSSVENIVGYSDSSLIGKTIKEILNGDINDETLAESFKKDDNVFQLKMNKADGSLLYLEGSTRRIIEHGRIVGVQAIARDITARKLMEDELHTKYKELQAVNEITNAVTGTLDLDEMLDIVADQVLAASQGLCSIVGLYDEGNEFILKSVSGVKLRDKSIVTVEASKQNAIELIGNKNHFVMKHQKETVMPNEYFAQLFKEEGFRYTLFNPIIFHGRHIGLISTLLKNEPTQELIELITSVGKSIAMSIDNAKAYEKVKMSYLNTVQSLVSTIEAKDMYTESHSIRVARYSTFIAKELDLEKSEIEDIWVAGVLHDIGKIGISDSILNKQDKLTDDEYRLVKQHPGIAYKILNNVGMEEKIMKAVRHHHERYDGKGYPDGLKGESINLMASIISVADAFDAITSERSYKKPKSLEEGMKELNACKHTQFNPKVVDLFTQSFESKKDIFLKIHQDETIRFF